MHRTQIREYRDLLAKLNVKRGDDVIVHADLRMFGRFEGGITGILEHLLDFIGRDGTLVTPAFTFSFPNSFDILKSQSNIGGMTSLFARHPDVVRVPDGMTSYYLIGARSCDYIEHWDNSSYGANSIIGQLIQNDGSVLQFGTDILSLIHYVEQKVGVPYRQIKRFEGDIISDSASCKSFTDFYARTKDVNKVIPDPIRS